MLPALNGNLTNSITIWTVSPTKIKFGSKGIGFSDPFYFTLYYTKTV